MHIKLVSVDPFSPVLKLELDRLPAVIGCNGRADIRVTDRGVSDRHCELLLNDGEIIVRDMKSKHGVFVNGVQVKNSAALQPDDTLVIGIRCLQISYQLDEPQSADEEGWEPPLAASAD